MFISWYLSGSIFKRFYLALFQMTYPTPHHSHNSILPTQHHITHTTPHHSHNTTALTTAYYLPNTTSLTNTISLTQQHITYPTPHHSHNTTAHHTLNRLHIQHNITYAIPQHITYTTPHHSNTLSH